MIIFSFRFREIDIAFLRRFERKILVDMPDKEVRVDIVKRLQPNSMKWTEDEFNDLIHATDGFTGADLRIALKEASLQKIREALKSNCDDRNNSKIDIQFKDLLAAIKQIKPSMLGLAEKHLKWNAKYGHQFTAF